MEDGYTTSDQLSSNEIATTSLPLSPLKRYEEFKNDKETSLDPTLYDQPLSSSIVTKQCEEAVEEVRE